MAVEQRVVGGQARRALEVAAPHGLAEPRSIVPVTARESRDGRSESCGRRERSTSTWVAPAASAAWNGIDSASPASR